jgi:hypothetical protein
MPITHSYVSTKADPPDTTLVGNTRWVAPHIDLVGIVSKSSAYVLASDDELCLVTGTTTITLPTAVGIEGKVYAVKRIGTNTVTIDTTSSQTIDGALTVSLLVQYDCLAVVSDGSNWSII